MQNSAGLWRDIAVLRGLEHDRRESERAVVMARARRGGAPWRTGLEPAAVPALLKRYLEPAGRDLATLRAERVVLAEVERGQGRES